MPKGTITFDELDKKTLEELPLLLEVIATTMSKMGDLLSEQFVELTELISIKILELDSWHISQKYFSDSIHKPFVDKIAKNQRGELPEPYYNLEFSKRIYKGNDDKPDNFFICMFGFYYSSTAKEYGNKPLVYYLLEKSYCHKYNGPNMPFSFYKKFEDNKLVTRLEHPNKTGNNELLEISTFSLSIESINQTFEYFKTEVLIPYLENLK